MDNFYNIGSGLVDVNATSVTTDTIICDDYNTQSGIANFNLSSLSNIQNVYANNNVISVNITSLSNSHIALSNSHMALSNSHMALSNSHMALSNSHMSLSNAHTTLSNTFVSYSNVSWKFNNSNVYLLSSSNVCIGTTNATQQLTLTRSIQASNLHTSNLIIYRGSNILDIDGKIDYSWIKNAPIQDDGSGVIVIPIPVVVYIYNNINPNINTDTGGDGNETYDPDTNSNAIYTHWRNVTYHPFYCRTGTDEQVAFGSNVFIEKNSKIYGVDAVDLIKTDAGRIRRLDTNLLNPTVFYDFANQEMFLKVINCSSNINASNIITSNITSSNSTFYNVYVQSNINSSNINSSNIYSSNFDTRILHATQSVLSNATLCNAFFTSNAIVNHTLISSNINSSNIFASNIETRTFISSNGIFSNLSTNLLQATSINSQTSIITTMTATNLSASNITSCNLTTFSNDYYTFSNLSWKFDGSNIYHGLNERVIAIGKSNATEKLDIQGNVKVSGGGSFANNNFVISSNTSAIHCLTINNSNIFRTDGTIGNHFLTQLNILAGNSNFAGTLGDIYNPQTQSSNLLTNWNSVVWKPLYHDSNYNLGFSSNVYFNRFSQLCTTEPSWDYTKISNGLYKTFNAPFVRSNVVIDFNTYTATLCNVITSNATISNNIFTSNINASNVTTSNLISRNANLSNLWASNIGINQVNPLYNLDVNGGVRIQRELLVNSNVTCACNLTVGSNLGIGTTNPAFRLDVIGTGMRLQGGTGATPSTLFINPTGAANTTSIIQFVNSSHQIACTDTTPYQTLGRASATGHNIYYLSGGHVFSGNMYCSNSVGIGNSNPSYALDVSGVSRISTTSLGIGSILQNSTLTTGTTQNIAFSVGKALSTNNTANFRYTHRGGDGSTNNYVGVGFWGNDDILNIQTNGNVGIRTTTPAQPLEVNGMSRLIGGVQISGINTVEFGYDVSGKQTDAGKIGYQTFTSGCLDIVGAGTTIGSRKVKLYDNVEIAGTLTIGGGTSYRAEYYGYTDLGSSTTYFKTTTITLPLGGASANYSLFLTLQQNTSVDDSFSVKWDQTSTSGTNNTITIYVWRANANSWTNNVRIHYHAVLY